MNELYKKVTNINIKVSEIKAKEKPNETADLVDWVLPIFKIYILQFTYMYIVTEEK